MASKWRTCTVDQIKANDDRAIVIGPFGSRMKADRYVAGGVPVIRRNNISDTRTLVGDLVFVSDETADEREAGCVSPSVHGPYSPTVRALTTYVSPIMPLGFVHALPRAGDR